jgi:transposase InsO family protein
MFVFAAESVRTALYTCLSAYLQLIGKLQSDHGGEFVNKLLDDFSKEYGIQRPMGKPRQPWVNGQVERANRTLKTALSKLLADNKTDWVTAIPKVLSKHASCTVL